MIYLDQGATSFPKAPGVAEAMHTYVSQVGVNVNRGSYAAATSAEETVLSLREGLCELFGLDDAARAILTPGMTWGLNMALKGLLRPGDHCIVSSMEHNAMMRPLLQLEKKGVRFSRIPADQEGRMDLDALPGLFCKETRLVAVCHASNVSGTLQPVEQIGKLCRGRGVFLLVDAAQTAGHYPLNMEALGADALCVPGHKGLLGPQGIGALLMGESFARELTPLVSGGTGSMSDSEELPPFLPDRFEPGTPNLPGIYGLEAAVRFIRETGVAEFHRQEMALAEAFLQGIEQVPGVRVAGPREMEQRVGVVSVDFLHQDNALVADALAEQYGIMIRCGLHCAPSAHKTLGTFPQGTVRFAFGYGNDLEQVEAAVQAVRRLA